MSNVDTVSTDVLIIGGGPSGLATAIHLADTLKQKGLNHRILLIEKGSSIGSHILSGAVIKPDVFKELLTGRILDNGFLPTDCRNDNACHAPFMSAQNVYL